MRIDSYACYNEGSAIIRRPLKGSERRERLRLYPTLTLPTWTLKSITRSFYRGSPLPQVFLIALLTVQMAPKMHVKWAQPLNWGGAAPPDPPWIPWGGIRPPDPPLHGFAKESDCEFHGDNVISREGQHVSTRLNRCWHFKVPKPQKSAFYHKSLFTRVPWKLAF